MMEEGIKIPTPEESCHRDTKTLINQIHHHLLSWTKHIMKISSP